MYIEYANCYRQGNDIFTERVDNLSLLSAKVINPAIVNVFPIIKRHYV